MFMIIRLFFQQPRSDLKVLVFLLYLLCGATPAVTLAATLHAIIMADTSDSQSFSKDRDNIKQLVVNIRDATGLKLNLTVIDKDSGFAPRHGYDTVTRAITELQQQITAGEDIVIFYYAGHGGNTGNPSSWPAMLVEGNGTEKSLELSWVKQTLEKQSPRLLIAIADTCNDLLSTPPTQGGNTILGEVGDYKQSYRKLFLGYQGVITASGSSPKQRSFYDQNGGRFTQVFLTNLKEELMKADDLNWEGIRKKSVEPMKVEPHLDELKQGVQIPQMEVAVVKVAFAGEEENGSHILSQPPLKPEIVCAQPTSGWGACYLNAEAEEKGRNWNVFVEGKVWLSTWQGWERGQPFSDKGDKIKPQFTAGGTDHFVSLTTKSTLVSILTLGYRYDRLSVGVSLLPKKSYNFPVFTRGPVSWTQSSHEDTNGNPIPERNLDSNEQITASAERDEIDVTVGYSILPELQLGIGFKRATLDYQYLHFSHDPFVSDPLDGATWTTKEKDKTYGVSWNIGGQICLANWLGVNTSMFGNFSYGALKTKWGSTNSTDYTTYHSTDLGLSWGLPKLKRMKPELRFGYRAQTLYTSVSGQDAVDTTEGFTLGIRLVY
jgi:hypothetical protein